MIVRLIVSGVGRKGADGKEEVPWVFELDRWCVNYTIVGNEGRQIRSRGKK